MREEDTHPRQIHILQSKTYAQQAAHVPKAHLHLLETREREKLTGPVEKEERERGKGRHSSQTNPPESTQFLLSLVLYLSAFERSMLFSRRRTGCENTSEGGETAWEPRKDGRSWSRPASSRRAKVSRVELSFPPSLSSSFLPPCPSMLLLHLQYRLLILSDRIQISSSLCVAAISSLGNPKSRS